MDTAVPLAFRSEDLTALILGPDGTVMEKAVQVRTDPLTGRTCRITFARAGEQEAGTAALPEPPPDAADGGSCPFCRAQLAQRTPQLPPELSSSGRLEQGESVLFPNLFPYGRYSAVSLIDRQHFVEIGKASLRAYSDSFINCRRYLEKVHRSDPAAQWTAITQNHLPAAGGSLLHPHLQVHADRIAPNHLRFLCERAGSYAAHRRHLLFSDYLAQEQRAGSRIIGRTGKWHWLAAFAPEGFFEIWGILPEAISIRKLSDQQLECLARGVLNTQKFYRSLNRNGYNLGLLSIETPDSRLELRIRLLVRANHAPWARNDHTGYEVMLGDMATFTSPEETARLARAFWQEETR
jgi:UDPglucose--hexose-1-phosphate uridylyltransferase